MLQIHEEFLYEEDYNVHGTFRIFYYMMCKIYEKVFLELFYSLLLFLNFSL